MPHGVHSTTQTAFRLPEGLLAWLREQAAKEKPVTMTDIVVRALEAERDRCTGITTRTVPAEPRTHALNCKCGTCKPTGGKR